MQRRAVLVAGSAGVVSSLLPAAAAHASGATVLGGGGSPSVRSFLSTAGRAAHDAVASGALFAVSADDYAAVRAGLTGGFTVAPVGIADDAMAPASMQWLDTYASRVPGAVWPAGTVLLGGRFGVLGSRAAITILVGSGPDAGHVALGPGAVPLSAGSWVASDGFLLRRDPVATVVERSLGCVGASGTTSATLSHRYAAGAVDGVWTFGATVVDPVARQQYLIATPV